MINLAKRRRTQYADIQNKITRAGLCEPDLFSLIPVRISPQYTEVSPIGVQRFP